MNTVNISSDFQKIYSQIKKMEKGTIFFSSDFDVSDKAVLRVYLSRMVNEGLIIRIASGIFLYPRHSDILGTDIIPSVDEIAIAICKKERSRIAPSGSHALYKIGLTTQIPTVAVFYTDGSARKIRLFDGRTIQFKAASAKNFAYKNKVIQTSVSALKEIGQNRITDFEINYLKNIIKLVDAKELIEDLKLAPEWIQRILQ